MKVHTILLLLVLVQAIKSYDIDETKRFMLDNEGRYMILHGGNAIFKLPPYLPVFDKFDPLFSLTTEEDLKTMKRLGFNFIRLGVIWESVETMPGIYDYEYLDKIEEIINTLGQNGIHVMVDAHQDVFSRNFCGEGVPYFYTNEMGYDTECNADFMSRIFGLLNVCKPFKKFGYRVDENGLPLIEDCKKTSFSDYFFTPEVLTSFKNLYENKDGIIDKFIEFWKVVVKRFKGNKFVLGYDLWNEPLAGDGFQDPTTYIPGKVDNGLLASFYKKVDEELRKIDDSYILFFEPTPVPDTLPILGGLFYGHMKVLPNSPEYKQVYNFHTYCCLAGASICANGEPDLKTETSTCQTFHEKKIKSELETGHDLLNVPMFITEFGACSDSIACYNEIMAVVKQTEKNFISWAYWSYKPYGDHTTTAIEVVDYEGIFNPNGTVQDIKEKGLSRGYVQYYQGYPLDFSFEDNSDSNFQTSFKYDNTIKANSVLYFNKDLFYKNGYNIQIVNDDTKEDLISSGAVKAEEVDNNYINIIVDSSKVQNETKIRVLFSSK